MKTSKKDRQVAKELDEVISEIEYQDSKEFLKILKKRSDLLSKSKPVKNFISKFAETEKIKKLEKRIKELENERNEWQNATGIGVGIPQNSPEELEKHLEKLISRPTKLFLENQVKKAKEEGKKEIIEKLIIWLTFQNSP